VCKALGPGGLQLRFVQAMIGGHQIPRVIGGDIQGKADDANSERRQMNPELGQSVIHQKKMDQERRPDKEGYVTLRPCPHGIRPAEGQVKNSNPAEKSGDRHNEHEENRIFQAGHDLRPVSDQVIEESIHTGYLWSNTIRRNDLTRGSG